MITQQASTHQSVLLLEALEALNIQPRGRYLDATFGRGGHSSRILEVLGKDGRLLAIDRDAEAEAVAAAAPFNTDARFSFCRRDFGAMAECLNKCGIDALEGVLMDLGVSSPQLDEAERGFSFRLDGPLDMRMDQSAGLTAAEWVNRATMQEMTEIFRSYGEERFASRIARAIIEARVDRPITRTLQLAEIVSAAHPRWERGKHPATRVFQAIRIHVNAELEQVSQALREAWKYLVPGGRLVVISFHSLEDRLVKVFMKSVSEPQRMPRGMPIADDYAAVTGRVVARKVRASAAEVDLNQRARSAVLRAAERTV